MNFDHRYFCVKPRECNISSSLYLIFRNMQISNCSSNSTIIRLQHFAVQFSVQFEWIAGMLSIAVYQYQYWNTPEQFSAYPFDGIWRVPISHWYFVRKSVHEFLSFHLAHSLSNTKLAEKFNRFSNCWYIFLLSYFTKSRSIHLVHLLVCRFFFNLFHIFWFSFFLSLRSFHADLIGKRLSDADDHRWSLLVSPYFYFLQYDEKTKRTKNTTTYFNTF